jgi:hypothetical protein
MVAGVSKKLFKPLQDYLNLFLGHETSNKFKKIAGRLNAFCESRHCLLPSAGGTTAAETAATAGKSTETAR